MLHLPDVTLVAVDTLCHDLTRIALADCMRRVDFGDVVVFSDKPEAVPDGAWHHHCEPLEGLDAVWNYLWYEVPKSIKTTHYLIAQWDGWIVKPQCWDNDFLNYDYIGAPWAEQPGIDVGNGGFSLRSMKLAKMLMDDRNLFPLFHPEDYHICKVYRPTLERRGIRFPDARTALRFSFECNIIIEDREHFGFHDFRNWPFVLTQDEIDERLTHANDYVLSRNISHMEQMKSIIRECGQKLGYMAQ